MRKIKLIAAAAVFSAAGFFGVQAYQNATMSDQEKMIQANIEALSEMEATSQTTCVGEKTSCVIERNGKVVGRGEGVLTHTDFIIN